MSEIFISYAHSTATQAQQVAEALRGLGYVVWRDDELPAHRPYAAVIDERLRSAKAVVVLWSAEAAKSQWVRAEADVARTAGTLVQVRIDGVVPPLPFNQIQCADLEGWNGDPNAPGWRMVIASLADLMGGARAHVAGVAAEEPKLPDKPSIAVLPFTDMTGAKDQAYFCDGMVVEIVTALSRFPSLFVIASGSSLTYREDRRSRKEIAAELGVRYLLEGSLRRSADKVRIAVQLVDCIAGGQVWNQRFDGTLEDVFALQDTVANAVAGELAYTIEAAEVRRGRARPTQDLGAYDLYLRARSLIGAAEIGKKGFERAIALLDEAIGRDPNYALALAFAGYCHTLIAVWGYSDTPAESRQTGLELARRALRSSNDDPAVLTNAGYVIAMAGGDPSTGEAVVERALSLNPGDSFAWYTSATLRSYDGRARLALARLETALRLDPRSPTRPFILAHMGWNLLFLRRFAHAIPLLREVGELAPGFEGPAVALVACYAHLGRIDEAKAVLATVRPDTIAGMFRFFRAPDCQAIIRSGLALAGVDA